MPVQYKKSPLFWARAVFSSAVSKSQLDVFAQALADTPSVHYEGKPMFTEAQIKQIMSNPPANPNSSTDSPVHKYGCLCWTHEVEAIINAVEKAKLQACVLCKWYDNSIYDEAEYPPF